MKINRQKYLKKIEEFGEKTELKNLKNHLDSFAINLNINDIESFYSSYDFDKPENRDLNSELDEYLFNKINEINFIPDLTVNINVPENFEIDDETIKNACHNHFEEKTILTFEKNHKTLNKWIFRMIGGLFFLGICLLASNLLRNPALDGKSFCSVLSEGFGIIGWVAIWEPACYLLYYRRDDKKTLKNYLILSTAKYNIIHNN